MATIAFDERVAATGMEHFFSVNTFLTPLSNSYYLGDGDEAIVLHGNFSYTGSYPNQVPAVGSIVTSADLWSGPGYTSYGAITGLNFDLHDLYVNLHSGLMDYPFIIGLAFGASTYIGTTHDDFLSTYASDDTLIGGDGNDNLYARTGIYYIAIGIDQYAPGDGPSNAVMIGGAGNDSFAIFDKGPYPHVVNVAGANEDGSGGAGEFNTLQITTNNLTIDKISNIQQISLTDTDVPLTNATLNLGYQTNLPNNLVIYNETSGTVRINILAYGDEALNQNNSGWSLNLGDVEVNYSSGGTDSEDFIVAPFGASKVIVHSGGGNDTLDMGYAQVVELDAGDGVDYLVRDLSFTSIDFVLDLTRSHNEMGFTGYIDNVERASVKGGAGDDRLTGGSYADTFYGNSGDDLILGGGGDDYLDGGSGYDILLGGAGKDTLVATLSSDGLDVMEGGAGDDRYYIDNKETTLAEKIGGGTDTVYSSVDWTLKGNFERLVLTGNAKNGTGNSEANELFGNGLNNVLKGGSNDDALVGNAGKDTLTGGSGLDRFYFNAALSASNVDTITDFNHVSDTLMFDDAILPKAPKTGWLAGGAFYGAAGATHGHDSSDRFVYNKSNGTLYYDKDGSGSAAAIKIAVLTGHPTLDATDFYIV